MQRLRLLVPLLALLGCQQQPSNPNCPPATAASPCPTQDAAPAPTDAASPVDAAPPPPTDTCGRGEQALLKLGCKDDRGRLLGGPNEHGVPWAQICRDKLAKGVDMKPACMSAAKSCTEVTSCR